MKNVFKYLGALALASTISLQATNVFAEGTCEPGQTVHTDYYMFLNEGTYSTYKDKESQMDAGNPYTYYTGTNKSNNILGKKILKDGPVEITRTSGSADSNIECSSIEGGCIESWTAAEYWKNYYEGHKNAKDLQYTKGNKTYIFHSTWYRYGENGFDVKPEEIRLSDTSAGTPLVTYIENNLSNLESSDLVQKGTSLPNTTLTPDKIENNKSANIYFKVLRAYIKKDIMDGVDISATAQKMVYSPGVYMVQYCSGEVSGEPGESTDNNEKEYTVTYDANGGENAPSSQSFKENSCFTVGNAPTRTDYTFLGWSRDKNATEPDKGYKVGEQACNVNEDITLYAVWKKMQYNSDGTFTVTYDANGGKNAPAPSTAQKGSCVKISNGKPTFAGLNFLGWSRDKDAKEPDKSFNAGTDYCGDNVTLYAVWQTKTGVSAHLIGFGLAAVAAGAALVVAKKKDLFKQI